MNSLLAQFEIGACRFPHNVVTFGGAARTAHRARCRQASGHRPGDFPELRCSGSGAAARGTHRSHELVVPIHDRGMGEKPPRTHWQTPQDVRTAGRPRQELRTPAEALTPVRHQLRRAHMGSNRNRDHLSTPVRCIVAWCTATHADDDIELGVIHSGQPNSRELDNFDTELAVIPTRMQDSDGTMLDPQIDITVGVWGEEPVNVALTIDEAAWLVGALLRHIGQAPATAQRNRAA